MDNVAPVDPDAQIKRNMPREIVSDLGRPLVGLIMDSYQNSFTSLSDVSRHLGLRAGQVSKVQELLSRG
jgi:hypothetical protein